LLLLLLLLLLLVVLGLGGAIGWAGTMDCCKGKSALEETIAITACTLAQSTAACLPIGVLC